MAHSVGQHRSGDHANACRSFMYSTLGALGGIARPIKAESGDTVSTQGRSMVCDAGCMSGDAFGNFDLPKCGSSNA